MLGRIWLLLLLLVLSIGAAAFLFETSDKSPPKMASSSQWKEAQPKQGERQDEYDPARHAITASGEEDSQISARQEDKFVKAQVSAFTEACANEARKNEDVKKLNMDIQGFCGCMAKAHMKLDLSITEEKARRKEFYTKGRPCFEDYLKPVIAKSCAMARATSGMNIDCTCMYAYSTREHLTKWIEGTNGKTPGQMNDQQREKHRLDVGMQIIKRCIK